MNKLYFTIGLPRSGKSTLCHNWADKVEGRVIVSGDDFRLAIHGQPYLPTAEGVVFSHMDVAIRALLLTGFDVIVDETATTEATILRYLRIDVNAVPIWVDTPLEVCQQRAIETGREYLIGPMKRHWRQFQELRKDWPTTFERLRQQVISRQPDDNPAFTSN